MVCQTINQSTLIHKVLNYSHRSLEALCTVKQSNKSIFFFLLIRPNLVLTLYLDELQSLSAVLNLWRCLAWIHL